MATRDDAIIIGAGHNGLVCAAYVARQGLRPPVQERRDIIGGAAVTEEIEPGFRAATFTYLMSGQHGFDLRISHVAGLPVCLARVRWTGQLEDIVMDDGDVTHRINELAHEEHKLFERESQGIATEADQKRLQHLEVLLDQCWDLLRQRRARREFGLNPDDARVRDERTVTNYTG
jgi:phytoene dehydrogenase-like protein